MDVKGCTNRACVGACPCNGREMPIGGKFTELKRTRLVTLESVTGVSIFEQLEFANGRVVLYVL